MRDSRGDRAGYRENPGDPSVRRLIRENKMNMGALAIGVAISAVFSGYSLLAIPILAIIPLSFSVALLWLTISVHRQGSVLGAVSVTNIGVLIGPAHDRLLRWDEIEAITSRRYSPSAGSFEVRTKSGKKRRINALLLADADEFWRSITEFFPKAEGWEWVNGERHLRK